MNREALQKILDIQERASVDEEYLQLYANYAPAQRKLQEMMVQLRPEQQEILEAYLCTAVMLYHRLMVLATEYTS